MVIQDLSKSLGDFFVDAGFVLDTDMPTRILKFVGVGYLTIGRYDVSDWVEFRTSSSIWSSYNKDIKQVVEKYEKFSGLQVFIKIS